MPPPPPSFNPNATRPPAGPSGATTRPSTVTRPGGPAATRPGAPATQTGLRGGRPPAAAAPARVDYGPLLDKLAADIEAMHLEYEKFFNGGLQVPPVASKSRVDSQLKQLRNAQIQSSADRFRLGSLEARFTSYSELFNRRLRDKEEGRRPRPSAVERVAPRYDAEAGINFGADAEPAAVEALFQRLHQGGTNPPRFDLDSFGTYLRSQLQAIQQKTGCREVQFRVATEEGKLKLKARPLGSR
jgi:hypothetical protein